MTTEEEDEQKVVDAEWEFFPADEAAMVFLISGQGQAYAIMNTADETLIPVFIAKLRQMADGLATRLPKITKQ